MDHSLHRIENVQYGLHSTLWVLCKDVHTPGVTPSLKCIQRRTPGVKGVYTQRHITDWTLVLHIVTRCDYWLVRYIFVCHEVSVEVRLRYIALRVHTSELRDITCYMGSHSVTCHPTQVNVPRLTPASTAGTRLTYPVGMEGWVDLGGWLRTHPKGTVEVWRRMNWSLDVGFLVIFLKTTERKINEPLK